MTEEKKTPDAAPAADAPEETKLPETEPDDGQEQKSGGEPDTEGANASEKAAETECPDEEYEAADDGKKPKRSEFKKLRRELEDTKKSLDAAQKHAAELDERLLRLAAEYDNFRKRTQSERAQVYASAVSDTLGGILPIIDNLQYAAKYAGGDPEKIAEGLSMILSKLPDTLEKLGIKAFGEPGDKFDPALHNAVMHVEDEEHGEGEIVEVLQQGYLYGDRVLRYAMVKTAN